MDKLREEKLNMWKKKLVQLEKDLESAMIKKGEAAAMGDLSENAAYKMAVEEVEMTQVRIDEVKNIIKKLNEGGN